MNMANKKLAGASIVVVVVGVLAIAPLMMYGTFVNASETTLQLQVSSSASPSIATSQLGSFSASIVSVSSKAKVVSSYEYVFAKIGGLASAVDDGGPGVGDSIVSIQFSIQLTTPSNRVLEFTFKPGELRGTGQKNVTVLLGPDELNKESGTFQITISITIKVTAPIIGNVVDLNLTPVSRSFDVPG